jgi:hypothetical protein
MKRNILSQLLVMAAFASAATAQAQVGIGTNSPSASAQLEVSSASKGFLPPRMALTATNVAGPVTSPATGLLVYNTATAGTSPNNVTPGYYYYDGAKWQRIITQQPDATVSFNTSNPNSGSPTFTPSNPASTDYIYVSSVDNSQWTYNGTTYVTYTPPASTPWMLSGGTSDAGSNKAGAIYRSGNVGIGTGTTAPAERLQIGTGFAFHDGGDKVLGLGVNPSTFNSLLTSQWPAEIRLDPSTGNLSFGTTSNGSAPALGAAATLTRRLTIARAGNVGIGTTSPSASALLDLTSTTLGFLPPSMTSTQRNAITSPAAGLVVYNNTDHRLDVRQNSTWRSMATLDGTETLTNKTISGSSNTINNVSLTSGVTGTLAVANGGTGVTTSTGSGNAVLATSPTLVTPIISTTTNFSTAGAIRYNTADGGNLEYHNGTEWKPLAATKKVAVYTEVHTNANNTGWYAGGSAFNDFGTTTADNVVAVYGSSYGFFNGTGTGSSSDKWVAPFTGKFRVTTNVYFNHNASYANPRVYAYLNNTTICNITSVNTGGQDLATCTSAIISMNQGDYINWKVEYNSQIWRGLYHTFFRVESVE